MSQLNPVVLAHSQSIPRIKSMPSSRPNTSVVAGMMRSDLTLLSFSTILQSLVQASPALGIGAPLVDTILTGTFRCLHGMWFLSMKARSKTEQEVPVSAMIRSGTDLELSSSLKTTCASKMKRFPFQFSFQTMTSLHDL